MIKIDNIYKTYNRGKSNAFRALKNVSLTIEKGEMVAIIGKSGAGKSTLMHILGTLESFDNGTYDFKGRPINDMPDKQLSALRSEEIGFVLQDFGLILEETVLNNVCVPLHFDKTKISQIKEKGKKAIETIGISNIMNKKVKQLSGGQKQRVAIARAIVNSPSLILADEPTGALDSATSEEIMAVFDTLNKNGTTVIIITHEPHIAQCCKRIVTISDGEFVD